jgi:hypothetical protein
MVAAQSEAHPDCREVNIKCDLVRRQTITSFVPKDSPEGYSDPRILLGAMDAVFVALTGPEKFNRQACIELLRSRMKEFRGDK